MLEFKPFSLKTLKRVLPYIKKTKSRCSELSAGSLFMWQDGYDLQFSICNDTLVLREKIGEQFAFSWPMGADIGGMIDELIYYVRANHLALRFFEIDDNILEIIKSDERLQPVMSAYEIRWSDYVYTLNDVLTFKGKKYRGQRNHINKFKRLYGEPDVRFITTIDREGIKEMLNEYKSEHIDSGDFEDLELKMTEELLDVYEELDMFAAVLTVGGKIAAISIGEVIGDTLIIHIEKALKKYDGIYPTMYQGFVRLILTKTGKDLKFVNREDDSGDEGLRISKMQYHPVGRVNKHLVHINSPAAKLKEIPVLKADGIVLNGFRESDKQRYLTLNTDIENNRYWGYDYREDEDIIGKIDENTFYGFTLLDIKAGDSVNFAVRTSDGGDMIGEAILWNFTFDGCAEVGCRILPEYQGKGYGKAAFKVAAEFAANELNLKVTARCFKENTVSYKMISASGFEKTGSDDEFYYFKFVDN